MKHLKNAALCGLFLALLIASLLGINGILEGKYLLKNSDWPTTSTYRQFYEMEEDSIDVLFLGSSLVVNAVIPQEIYNEYGIRSYNLASEQQSIFLSYYWLREALRFQHPAAVVLDTKFMWLIHPESVINTTEALTRKCLTPMKWSPVKREAVHELCRLDPAQSELSYYLTNIRFHSRWTELQEYDLSPAMLGAGSLMGYGPLTAPGLESFETFESADTSVTTEFLPLMQEYLDKITALCREEGIRLILISLPGNDMNDEAHNSYTRYAEENGLDYYNFCSTEIYRDIGAELPEENIVWHANVWGAVKESRYIGGLLRDTCGLPAVRDEQYERAKTVWAQALRSAELVRIGDQAEYLRALCDPGFAVFLAVQGNAGNVLPAEPIREGLRGLGLQVRAERPPCSFAAVVLAGEVAAEESGDWPIFLSGSFRGGRAVYTLQSNGENLAPSSSIVVEGVPCSRQEPGLNIAVYDLQTNRLIDRVTLRGAELVR